MFFFRSGVYNYTHTPNYIQVLLGSVKRSRDLENGALLLRAVKILHHPDMKWTGEGTIYWDIALIKLERPVTFTSLIQPVCLSSPEDVPVTSTCFLTGWGSIERNHGIDSPSNRKFNIIVRLSVFLHHINFSIIKPPIVDRHNSGVFEGGQAACLG